MPGSKLVSSNQHAALIELRAASDADIKPVVKAVQASSDTGGFSVAITGDHTVGMTSRLSRRKTSRTENLASGFPSPSSCWCSCSVLWSRA